LQLDARSVANGNPLARELADFCFHRNYYASRQSSRLTLPPQWWMWKVLHIEIGPWSRNAKSWLRSAAIGQWTRPWGSRVTTQPRRAHRCCVWNSGIPLTPRRSTVS